MNIGDKVKVELEMEIIGMDLRTNEKLINIHGKIEDSQGRLMFANCPQIYCEVISEVANAK